MSLFTIAARIAFWLALAGAVYFATSPQPPHLTIDQFGDKFEHILAFSVMALLAAAAYPGFPLIRLAERLSFLGALIEVVQSIPSLHRDCDIMDWVADTAAICTVLLVAGLIRRVWSARRPASAI